MPDLPEQSQQTNGGDIIAAGLSVGADTADVLNESGTVKTGKASTFIRLGAFLAQFGANLARLFKSKNGVH
jgi:hypothetical protein